MIEHEQEYLSVMGELLECKTKDNRTGISGLSKIFNHSEYNLGWGRQFPANSTKFLPSKSVLGELVGFCQGITNSAQFKKLGCGVWDANANGEGQPGRPNKWLTNPFRTGEDDLGRIYGKQWRKWQDTQLVMDTYDQHMEAAGYEFVGSIHTPGQSHPMNVWQREIDQLANVVNTMLDNPNDRRMIISAWNVADLDKMALPPCHVLQHYLCEELTPQQRYDAELARREEFDHWYQNEEDFKGQFDLELEMLREEIGSPTLICHDVMDQACAPKHSVNLIMYQRSADYMLGSPFNIASYAAMLQVVGRLTNTAAGTLHYLTGDTHLYENHLDATMEQLERVPQAITPRLLLNPDIGSLEQIDNAKSVDEVFRLVGYDHQGKLDSETPMAV